MAVLSVEGSLEGEQVATARNSVRLMIEDRHVVDVVVDLSRCPFINSEGLELFLWLKRRAEELFGRVKLAGCDDTLRKILEMTRLRSRFECVQDLESAVRQMRA